MTVSDETLADDSAGGIKLVGEGNRITVNNTIDERLGLLEDKMLPEIRADLFGLNEVRPSASLDCHSPQALNSSVLLDPRQNRKFYT